MAVFCIAVLRVPHASGRRCYRKLTLWVVDGADKQLDREVADVNKEFGNIVIAFHQKCLKKSLDKELIRIIDTASPKMWVQIRQAHRAAIEGQLDEMKEILEEVGRGADAIKEQRTLRKFADELVAPVSSGFEGFVIWDP